MLESQGSYIESRYLVSPIRASHSPPGLTTMLCMGTDTYFMPAAVYPPPTLRCILQYWRITFSKNSADVEQWTKHSLY